MGLAQTKLPEQPRMRPAVASTVPLPAPEQIGAFLAVARIGSFSGAAADLGVGLAALQQDVRALEELLGLVLVEQRTGALTPSGQDAARSIEAHQSRLADDLGAITATQPTLTVALPGGPAGSALWQMLKARAHLELGHICVVPAWSSASMTFRADARGEDCENLFLFADEWAAVAGPGWKGPRDLDTATLKRLPLVAVTPEEHEAWHMILEEERPSQLFRASRRAADEMIANGAALGVANIPLLRGMPEGALKPVSRRHVWPGSGLWVSLHNGALAWDRGWALANALKAAFSAHRDAATLG
ncbi:MAG: LysR family transcriptional regulator [Pseudomonadota bacterium]